MIESRSLNERLSETVLPAHDESPELEVPSGKTNSASGGRGVAEFVSDKQCYWGRGCSRVCQ